jgi:ubiquinol-cytochrome c reductase cytochrome c subunit
VRFLNRSANRWAGRISRHRRGPVAGFLVLLTGLLMMGGLYTAFSPAQAQSEQTTEELVARSTIRSATGAGETKAYRNCSKSSGTI